LNNGLYITLAIGAQEARNGTQRLLTLPGGKVVTVVIPAGTPDGYLFYIDGQGNTHSRYDLIGAPLLTVTVRIEAETKPDVGAESYQETERGAFYLPPTLLASDRKSPALESTAAPSPYDGPSNNEPMFGSIPPPPPPPPLPSPLPTPRPARSMKLVIVLVAVCLLVVVAGIIGVGTYQNSVNQARVAATATAQANATATTTAQARSTAAAIASATASAVAADATTIAANPYPSYLPGRGTLALYDPLTRPFAWPATSNTSFGGSCQFTGGAYQVSVMNANRFYECTTSHTYSDFAFQVQMNIQQGDCGGMTFRDDQNGKNYRFVICQSGDYALFLNRDFSGSHNTTLSQGTVNHTIAQGTIAVAAKASSIGIYYDGQQIINVSDATFGSGGVGLLAESLSHATQVNYSDAKVWTLS
jgi:Flp pilus assembly protein TadG